MHAHTPKQPVLEFRVALTAQQYERILQLYTIGLGLEPAARWENEGGQAVMLALGRGALEIFDEPQAETIDRLEAGRRVSGPIRFAFQVPDLEQAMERMIAAGAVQVHPPVRTPWEDYNVRLEAPDGMQITLFQAKGA